MFHIDYRVKGEDVNDHMAMESHSYFSYSTRHVYNFLFQLGYSRQRLNKLSIMPLEQKSYFELIRPLMFGNHFNIMLHVKTYDPYIGSFELKNSFFNSSNELCAIITSETILDCPKGHEVLTHVTKKIINYGLDPIGMAC